MELSPLFTKQKISKNVTLESEFINSKIDESIISKLNRETGGRCSREGYIKRNSISIAKKSLGHINIGEPDKVIYNVSFTCDICNPIEGNIYKCVVENKNKMGVIAYSAISGAKPLYVLIPRDYIGEEHNMDSIHEEDIIHIKVVGKRFKHNDSIIQVIGEIVFIE